MMRKQPEIDIYEEIVWVVMAIVGLSIAALALMGGSGG